MYDSPDNILSVDAPTALPACYQLLSTPQKKVEIDERDVRFLASTAHLALCAFNFSEVMLQAWDASLDNIAFYMRTRKCLSSVVKTIMQTQLAITNGCLQLRRDHYLSQVKGLSPDAIFAADLLKEVDKSNQKQLQAKAFLRFALVATSRHHSGRGQDKTDGDFRTGYHPSAPRPAKDQKHLVTASSTARLPFQFLCAPFLRKRGGTKYLVSSGGSITSQVVSVSSVTQSVTPPVTPSVTPSVTLSTSSVTWHAKILQRRTSKSTLEL